MADVYLNLGANYRLHLWASEQSQNVGGNTTTLVFSLALEKVGGTSVWSNYTSNRWTLTLNGTQYTGTTSYNFGSYSTLNFITNATQVVGHNSDGTKTVGATLKWEDTANAIPDGETTGWFNLATIPRASTPTLPNGSHYDAGTPVTVNTNPASGAFTHDVQVFMGSIATTVATGLGSSGSFTIPMAWLSEFPDVDRAFATLRLLTYSGSTLIGYKDIAFAVRAPASAVPTIATVTAAEATAGLEANVGAGKFVQGQSTLNVAFTGEGLSYGSPIVSRKITVAGQTINAASGTTGVITQAGTGVNAVKVIASVTDARGRTGTKELPIDVLAWAQPTITAVNARRATSGGVDNADGTYINVTFTSAVSSLINTTERNARSYRLYTRLRGATDWGTAKVATTAIAGVGPTAISRLLGAGGVYPITQAHEVRIEVQDDFTFSFFETTVATSAIFMHWASSLGIGVGKYWAQGSIDSLGQIFQNNGQRVIDVGNFSTYLAATNAETQAGTLTDHAVTPASLRAHMGVPYAVATGSAQHTAAIAHQGSVKLNITFPAGRFTVPPIVQVTSNYTRLTVGIEKGHTATSGQIGINNWSGTATAASASDPTVVYWTAYQMTPTTAAG